MNKQSRKDRYLKMYEAILSLETVDEAVAFFDDICTMTELMAIEQRYHVAECLSRGMIYSDILTETGASSATISRVNRSLLYGKGGYNLAFERVGNGLKAEDMEPAGGSGLDDGNPA